MVNDTQQPRETGPGNLADVLTAEILDTPKDYGRVDVGGVHYRWQ